MTNQLLNPYNFIDGNGNQPPTSWNGTAYVLYQGTDLGLLNAPSDGDSLTFSISSTNGTSSFHASCIGPYGDLLQLVSGSTSAQSAAYSVALPVGSTSYVLSVTVGAGDIVTLTPTADAPPPGPDPGQGPAPAPAPAPFGGKNIMLDAANWSDDGGNQPPACWDGTSYAAVSQLASFTFQGLISTGDRLVFDMSGTGGYLAISTDQRAVLDLTSPTIAPVLFDLALTAGDTGLRVTMSGGEGCNSGSITVTPPAVVIVSYNCDCDDDYPSESLVDLRTYLMIRLGFAAMLTSPPPGMTDLLNSFVIEAQDLLYRKYTVFRLERWFTWNMTPGTRFYDFAGNADVCTKKMDPRKVTWVGISQGDNSWRPLHCGIEPTRYSSQGSSLPDSYEIRQCIEVWPAAADDTWQLRIKGDFGLLPFAGDSDVSTIDPQPIKLLALANAKAHYGQSDAGNYMQQLTTLIGDLTAGSHHTRRYVPGTTALLPAVRPRMAD